MPISHEQLRDLLAIAARAKYGDRSYIEEVFDSAVIIEVSTDTARQYWKHPYVVGDDGAITLGDGATVERIVSWVRFSDKDEAAYTWEETEKGKYKIKGVPIFELGEHRGFNYDAAWAKRALANFSRLKAEKGYVPPVIIGHTGDDDSPQKPAVGFIENLRLVGTQFIADLANIGAEIFEQIKAGMWPYRSVEVYDNAAQFTALALLGGTPPYMKTPPLAFGAEAGKWVSFNAPETKEQVMPDVKTPATQEQLADVQAKLDASEKLRAEEKSATEARLAKFAEDARQSRIKETRTELSELGLTPAVLDSDELGTMIQRFSAEGEIVKFKDKEEPGLRGLVRFVAMLIDQAKKDAFLRKAEGSRVPDGEGGEVRMEESGDEQTNKFGVPIDSGSIERKRKIDEVLAAGKYNHLPEDRRRWQAIADLEAGILPAVK